MNVEIGAEAALFPEKEYINGIAVAVFLLLLFFTRPCKKGLLDPSGDLLQSPMPKISGLPGVRFLWHGGI
jgi:hypothetical protein